MLASAYIIVLGRFSFSNGLFKSYYWGEIKNVLYAQTPALIGCETFFQHGENYQRHRQDLKVRVGWLFGRFDGLMVLVR